MVDNEQGSFFTGLSDRKGTKPGFHQSSDNFRIRFDFIQCENLPSETQRRFIKDRFESCYDWQRVMELALDCLEDYYDDGDFQLDLQYRIKDWLGEFEGWGLLFALLPMDFQKFLLVIYSHLSLKYNEEHIVKTNEEMFDDLMQFYSNETQGLPLSDLVPKVRARLRFLPGGSGENERVKTLKVSFRSTRFDLIAIFSVEKRRHRRSLVEHAAEVVGRYVEDPDDLEIPETLKPIVSEKIIDAEWVAMYWITNMRCNDDVKLVSHCDIIDIRSDIMQTQKKTGPNIFTRMMNFIIAKVRHFFGWTKII